MPDAIYHVRLAGIYYNDEEGVALHRQRTPPPGTTLARPPAFVIAVASLPQRGLRPEDIAGDQYLSWSTADTEVV